jgi:hypothetical protein
MHSISTNSPRNDTAITNKKDCPHCWDSLLMFSSEYYTASQTRSKISMDMAMVFVTIVEANLAFMTPSLLRTGQCCKMCTYSSSRSLRVANGESSRSWL